MFYLLPWALSARARQFQAMANGVDLRFNQWTQNTRSVRARTDKRSNAGPFISFAFSGPLLFLWRTICTGRR